VTIELYALAIAIAAISCRFAIRYGRRFVRERREAREFASRLIKQLEDSGFDFGAVSTIGFFLYFEHEVSANSAAEQLKASGYDVSVRSTAEGNRWLCLAEKNMPTALAGKCRSVMEKVARRFGGQYDGWEAGPLGAVQPARPGANHVRS
jgi:regulator of ribonuclease activity B